MVITRHLIVDYLAPEEGWRTGSTARTTVDVCYSRCSGVLSGGGTRRVPVRTNQSGNGGSSVYAVLRSKSMPKIPDCLISVDVANALRALIDATGLKVPGGDLGFRCPECHGPVKPHGGAAGTAPHFEHLRRDPDCSLSHRLPAARPSPAVD